MFEQSDEEGEEEKQNGNDVNNNKVDHFKMNAIKNEVHNIDGGVAGSGNCRSQFLPMS